MSKKNIATYKNGHSVDGNEQVSKNITYQEPSSKPNANLNLDPAQEKITAMQDQFGNRAAVQLLKKIQHKPAQSNAAKNSTAGTTVDIQAIAAQGIHGSGHKLPHIERIQAAFGKYDVSNIQAHTDKQAAAANRSMGAQAYATGNKVAFANSNPDLFTAAHEAAHIVQQRAGVHLKGGVGAEGDCYEQHADAVAQAVIQGRNAESMLSLYAPSSDNGSALGNQFGFVQMSKKGQKGDFKKLEEESKSTLLSSISTTTSKGNKPPKTIYDEVIAKIKENNKGIEEDQLSSLYKYSNMKSKDVVEFLTKADELDKQLSNTKKKDQFKKAKKEDEEEEKKIKSQEKAGEDVEKIEQLKTERDNKKKAPIKTTYTYDAHGDKHFGGDGSQWTQAKKIVNSMLRDYIKNNYNQELLNQSAVDKKTQFYLYAEMGDIAPLSGTRNEPYFTIQITVLRWKEAIIIEFHGYPEENAPKFGLVYRVADNL